MFQIKKNYTIERVYDSSSFSWSDIFRIIYKKLTFRKANFIQKVVLSFLVLLFVGYGYLNLFFKYNSYTIEMPGAYLDASVFSKSTLKTGVHSVSVKQVKVDSFEKYIAVKILNYGHNDLIRKLPVKETNQQKEISVGNDLYDMQMTAYLAVKNYMKQDIPYTQKVIVTEISVGGSVQPNLLPSDEIISIDGKKVTDSRDVELSQLTYRDRQVVVRRSDKEFTFTSTLYGVRAKRVISLTNQKDYNDFYEFANLELTGVEGRSAGASLALYNYVNSVEDIVGNKNVAVTGTIDSKGNIGFVTGVTQKAILAIDNGADYLFVPKDNYLIKNKTEAELVKKSLHSSIEIIEVDSLSDIINRLKRL